MVTARRIFALALAATPVGACTDTFADPTPIVTGARLLAVQTVPAEAAPGASFTLTPLYVDTNGATDPSAVDWAICLLQKPLGEPGPINPGCFVDRSSSLAELGTGGQVSGAVDASACELFGPDSPPPLAGQPSARPTDADSTGGYYLPVRIKTAPDPAGDPWSVALERVSCQPSGVTSAVFSAFETQYQANANPTVASLAQRNADGSTAPIAADPAAGSSGAAAALTVAAGARVSLQVAWPDCTAVTDPTATCGGAEGYVAIDPIARQLTTRREAMTASYFATGGSFTSASVGRDEADPTANVVDTWTAPSDPGTAHLWIVLRDSRGGTGWASYTVAVE